MTRHALRYQRKSRSRRVAAVSGLVTALTASILGLTLSSASAYADTSIWPSSSVPTVAADPDTSSVDLGVRFSAAQAGWVTGVKFYRSAQNTGTHVGMLWNSSGQLLAQQSLPASSTVGWVTVPFATPVKIQAGTTYIASYLAPNGRYADDTDFFTGGRTITGGGLTATQGVYTYGSGVPDQSWRNSNYYVDVTFTTSAPTSSSSSTTRSTRSTTSTTTRSTTTAAPTTTSTTRTTTTAPTTTTTTRSTTSTSSIVSTAPAPPTGGSLSLPRVPWEGGSAYYSQFRDPKANGWASDSFFPIGVWWGVASTDAEVQWDKAHGINTYIVTNQNTPYDLLARNKMSYIGGQLPGSTRNSSDWVGDFLDDEVDGRYSVSDGLAYLQGLVNQLPDHNKIRYANFTGEVISWLSAADSQSYVNRFTDGVSVDKYWYTVSECSWDPFGGGAYLVPIPQSSCRTASSYGKTVDALRQRDAADGKLQPVWNFIEDVYGSAESGTLYTLTPAQLKGASMNSIIHEARGLIYFNNAFRGPCETGGAMRTAEYNPSWTCAPLIEAMGQVNNQIEGLAPVLNTQSYVWNFGTGIDSMLKVKDGYAYIFAMTTNGGTGSRTFTLPAGVTGGTVQVLDENRTLPVSGKTFSDSFSSESSYHIYKIAL